MGVVGKTRELGRAVGQQLAVPRHRQIGHEIGDMQHVEGEVAGIELGTDARQDPAGRRGIIAARHIEEWILGLEGVHEARKLGDRDRGREAEHAFLPGGFDDRGPLVSGKRAGAEQKPAREHASQHVTPVEARHSILPGSGQRRGLDPRHPRTIMGDRSQFQRVGAVNPRDRALPHTQCRSPKGLTPST